MNPRRAQKSKTQWMSMGYNHRGIGTLALYLVAISPKLIGIGKISRGFCYKSIHQKTWQYVRCNMQNLIQEQLNLSQITYIQALRLWDR